MWLLLTECDQWHIQTVWETGIPIWAPKHCRLKTLIKFSFPAVFQKKYVEVTINDFAIHLIISKRLRIQKSRQKRKTMRRRCRSKIRNCQRNSFHSFNYVMDHASIRFFFDVNSLHCFVWFLLYYLLHLLSSYHFAALTSS